MWRARCPREAGRRTDELLGNKTHKTFVKRMARPAMLVLGALLEEDSAELDAALTHGLESHRRYHQSNRRQSEVQGFVAFHLLGLVCAAHDRGVPVTTRSVCIPQHIVTAGRSRPQSPGPAHAALVEQPIHRDRVHAGLARRALHVAATLLEQREKVARLEGRQPALP